MEEKIQISYKLEVCFVVAHSSPGYGFTKDPDLIFEGLVRSAFYPGRFLSMRKLTLWY